MSLIPRQSHPAKPSGEGSDAPPTLKRSGSEHREGAVSSSPLRVSVPCRGNRKGHKDY